MYARGFFVLLLFMCGLGACTDDAPTRLSSVQMEVLDSLVTEQMPLVREETDSLCALNFEQRLRHMVDSLLTARHEEEARLRQRIPLQ